MTRTEPQATAPGSVRALSYPQAAPLLAFTSCCWPLTKMRIVFAPASVPLRMKISLATPFTAGGATPKPFWWVGELKMSHVKYTSYGLLLRMRQRR